jgi:hypothetical protein
MIRVDFFQVDSARSIAPFALGRNSKGNRCVGHRRPFQLISVELSRLIAGTANARQVRESLVESFSGRR